MTPLVHTVCIRHSVFVLEIIKSFFHAHLKLHSNFNIEYVFIGVGRFRIFGGPRFRILGEPRGGGQIPSRHMTS